MLPRFQEFWRGLDDLQESFAAEAAAAFCHLRKWKPNKYSAVQINVVKGCVSGVLVYATLDTFYLDSRVHAVSFISNTLISNIVSFGGKLRYRD